jgi:hypothetical protein
MESLKVNIHSPYERKRKALKRQELQDCVRRRYSVIMPSPSTQNKLVDDFPRVTVRKINICYHEDELIRFWRQNKEAYDFKEEERRDLAFFHRRDMVARNSLCHQLCEHFICKYF